jgi:glycine betaine/proline transport system substrate-binding protein
MNKKLKKLIALFSVCILMIFITAGCNSASKKADSKKKTVKLVYANWVEGIATTNLTKAILEDKMGYTVETTMGDVGIIFTSLSQGDSDVFLDGWLPKLHADYMKKYKDSIVDLGINYKNAPVGLVVPSYVKINSIEELNSMKDEFDKKIIGIDSGANIMKVTENLIKDYNLDFELVEGSGPTMIAMLKAAIDKKKPIVVIGWKPHWKFAKWDLKFLEDPKKMYGEPEDVHTLARKGLEEDMPEVYQFYKNFKMDDKQLNTLLKMINDNPNKEPIEVCREWIKQNEDVVNSWIPKK